MDKNIFNVGDFVACNNDMLQPTLIIVGVFGQNYLVKTTNGEDCCPTIEYLENHYHRWTIADAKDGDVLVCPPHEKYQTSEEIFIFKGLYIRSHADNYIDSYCQIHQGKFYENKTSFMGTTSDVFYPATKEQRDLLFSKMKEACYEWDAEKKELKKIETKFHVGEWITNGEANPAQISSIKDGIYFTHNDTIGGDIESMDKEYHLWNIAYANDGDVLVYPDGSLSIFKYRLKGLDAGLYMAHVVLTDKIEGKQTCTIKDVQPATKEQRDTLFARMRKEGYEWDSDKKKVRKLGQSEATKTSEQEEGFIEIPFGATDSELQEATYYIPKGFHAEIQGDSVVIKKGEQKPADSIEPKFHEGELIVDNCGYVWKIEGILNQLYVLEGIEGGESRPTIEWVDKTFHLWSIQDAKDGDVIVTANKNIFIFKSITDCTVYDYCGLYHGAFLGFSAAVTGSTATKLPTDYVLATKEQRDLLFSKMREAGYEWDAEKKELKEIESEEELSDFESALFSAFSDGWQQYLNEKEVDVAQWAREHSAELLEAANQMRKATMIEKFKQYMEGE